MKKRNNFQFRMTQAEKTQFFALAENKCVSLSALIRDTLNAMIEKPGAKATGN